MPSTPTTDHSAALLEQIRRDLEAQGVTGAVSVDGATLTVDVAGTPHTIHVTAGTGDGLVG